MDFDGARFVKARRSGGNEGNCVECTFDFVPVGVVGVRDSKDQAGPVLAFPTADWSAFVTATRAEHLSPAR
ncbi:DUF397 domain-containing protein [Longispora sp. NPDC051575]|uniref:DUF397 domain-containing protein n=1 Tax=Longispora sp. NPDC051575 TaxID=3154943 RepID=UPI003425E121